MDAISKSIVFSCLVFCMAVILAYPPNAMDDVTLSQTIQDRLLTSVSPAEQIIITADKGHITLGGSLINQQEAAKAIEIAAATPGVRDVQVGSLLVNGVPQILSDSAITAQLNGIFLREKLFGNEGINIVAQAKNHVVYLSGTATSEQQVDKAVALAQAVEGVSKTETRVNIEQGNASG